VVRAPWAVVPGLRAPGRGPWSWHRAPAPRCRAPWAVVRGPGIAPPGLCCVSQLSR